jgi:hypothetical protein
MVAGGGGTRGNYNTVLAVGNGGALIGGSGTYASGGTQLAGGVGNGFDAGSFGKGGNGCG